jgi:cell division protein FtsZ
LLINISAGSDFSIGEAHEAMEYLLQFADPDDADIIMGHTLDETLEGQVAITLLAAGMNPATRERRDEDVFFAPSVPATPPLSASNAGAAPIQLDELDLDIPTFLRRQKGG